MSVEPSRRDVLRLAGLGLTAGLLTACTSDGTGPPPPPPTADERARAVAVRIERELAEQARRTASRHPALPAAAAAAAAHDAHAQALEETLAPTPSASAGGPTRPVPERSTAAAAALARAERKGAEAHREALAADGVTGALARLLASVAGSDDALAEAVTSAAARS